MDTTHGSRHTYFSWPKGKGCHNPSRRSLYLCNNAKKPGREPPRPDTGPKTQEDNGLRGYWAGQVWVFSSQQRTSAAKSHPPRDPATAHSLTPLRLGPITLCQAAVTRTSKVRKR